MAKKTPKQLEQLAKAQANFREKNRREGRTVCRVYAAPANHGRIKAFARAIDDVAGQPQPQGDVDKRP